jgi:hypothetical protein
MLNETTNAFQWPAEAGLALDKRLSGINADVERQHHELHGWTVNSGYEFPKPNHKNYAHDPVLFWTGGGSRRITNLAVDLHQGMSRDEAKEKHGEIVLSMHDKLMSHLTTAPALPKDVHVYAGISSSFADNIRDRMTKDLYFTTAPISSSLHPIVAHKRSWAGHLITVLLHGNTSPGLYIGGAEHGFGYEREFIIKPKRKLLFTGRSQTTAPDNQRPVTVHNFVDVTDK